MERLGLAAVAAGLVAAGCGGSGDVTEPADLSIRIEVASVGNAASQQPVSVRWTAPSGRTGNAEAPVGASVLFDVPEAGSYGMEITSLADHCFADETATTASVADGVVGTASLDVACIGGFAHVHGDRVLVYRDLAGGLVEHEYTGRLFVFDWDSTGRYLLFRENDVTGCPLWIFDEQTGGVTEVIDSRPGLAGPDPVWAPDAARFAVLRTGGCATNGAGDAVFLVDPATGAALDSITGLTAATGVAWGPAPDRLAYTDGNEIRWRDLVSGDDGLLASLTGTPVTLAWSPQRDLLAATVQDGGGTFLQLFDPDGAVVGSYGGAGSDFSRLQWSPDGTLLAFGTEGDGGTTVVDRSGAEVFTLERRGGGFAAFPRWSPDSGALLFTGNDGSRNYVGWVDATGTDRRTLTDDTGDEDEPNWAGGSEAFLYHTVVDGGLALYLGTLDGTVNVELSDLSRSGFPRWRPDVTLELGPR